MGSNGKRRFISKMLDGKIESTIGTVFFIILFVVIILQVFSREIISYSHILNIPLPFNPPIWTEEGARWAWIWMVYIMLGTLERTGGHLKAGFLDKMASTKPMKIITLVLDFAYLALLFFLFVRGIIQTVRGFTTTPITLPLLDSFLFIVLPISLVFVIAKVIYRIIGETKNLLSFSNERSE